jgi:hypothetical protein
MAGERYLFTRNYVQDDGVVASTPGSSVGTNTPDLAIDYDRSTGWETVDALPQLKIDLGAAYLIDSVWFRGANVANWRLYYSTDDISYSAAHANQTGNSDGYNRDVGFTAQSARYWRLDVTTEVSAGVNSIIYEIMLMELEITYLDGQAIGNFTPSFNDRGGGTYDLANGGMKTFSGMTGIKQAYNVELTFVPQSVADDHRDLIDNSGNARPIVSAMLEPDNFNRTFEMIFEPIAFEYPFETQYEGAGVRIQYNLMER